MGLAARAAADVQDITIWHNETAQAHTAKLSKLDKGKQLLASGKADQYPEKSLIWIKSREVKERAFERGLDALEGEGYAIHEVAGHIAKLGADATVDAMAAWELAKGVMATQLKDLIVQANKASDTTSDGHNTLWQTLEIITEVCLPRSHRLQQRPRFRPFLGPDEPGRRLDSQASQVAFKQSKETIETYKFSGENAERIPREWESVEDMLRALDAVPYPDSENMPGGIKCLDDMLKALESVQRQVPADKQAAKRGEISAKESTTKAASEAEALFQKKSEMLVDSILDQLEVVLADVEKGDHRKSLLDSIFAEIPSKETSRQAFGSQRKLEDTMRSMSSSTVEMVLDRDAS
ncbi:hypothetical protein HIM_01887 [Hirsutella minnesotensis 3608]|nr:hypothetical protein HIM_01887 [Hirsutella minnesotensis 3608]